MTYMTPSHPMPWTVDGTSSTAHQPILMPQDGCKIKISGFTSTRAATPRGPMVRFGASLGRLPFSAIYAVQSPVCEPSGSCPRASDPRFKEYRSAYRSMQGTRTIFFPCEAASRTQLCHSPLSSTRITSQTTFIKWASYPLITELRNPGYRVAHGYQP